MAYVNIFGCASASPLIMFVNTPIGHLAGDLMQEKSGHNECLVGLLPQEIGRYIKNGREIVTL